MDDEGVRLDKIEALLTLLQQVNQQKQPQYLAQEDGLLTDWLTQIAIYHPPTFKGQEDPILLESWIRNFEKLYTAVNFPLERRVNMAAYYLRERADDWWRVRQAEQNLSWDHFKEALWKQFYPERVKREKHKEFMTLRQGDMSVGEYYAKFVELARFAPEFTACESLKVYHFERGLNYNIQIQLACVLSTDLRTVYEQACNIFHVLKGRSKALGSSKMKYEGD